MRFLFRHLHSRSSQGVTYLASGDSFALSPRNLPVNKKTGIDFSPRNTRTIIVSHFSYRFRSSSVFALDLIQNIEDVTATVEYADKLDDSRSLAVENEVVSVHEKAESLLATTINASELGLFDQSLNCMIHMPQDVCRCARVLLGNVVVNCVEVRQRSARRFDAAH